MAGGTEAEWPLYQLMGFLDPMIIPRRTHSNIQSDGSSQSTSGVWDTMPTIMGSDEDAPPTPDEENRARTPQAEAGTEVQPEPERPESQGASSRFAHRRRQLLRRGSVSRGAPVPVQVNNHMMGKMDEIVRFITQQNVVENDDILFGRSFGMTLSYVRNRQKKALLKANVMRQLGQLLAEDEADQDLQQPE